MDSDEGDFSYEEEDDEGEDSDNFSVDDDGFDSNYDLPSSANVADDFTYEVLKPDRIVSNMNAIIDEVDAVFQVCFQGFKIGSETKTQVDFLFLTNPAWYLYLIWARKRGNLDLFLCMIALAIKF